MGYNSYLYINGITKKLRRSKNDKLNSSKIECVKHAIGFIKFTNVFINTVHHVFINNSFFNQNKQVIWCDFLLTKEAKIPKSFIAQDT